MRQDDYPLAEPFPDAGAKLAELVVGKPPRWWFHGLLALPTAGLLWAGTQPGGGGDAGSGWLLLVLIFALCWSVRLVAFAVCQFRVSAWFVLAPLAGLLVGVALDADVPMKARWSLAQDDFGGAVEASAPGGEGVRLPGRIGTYRVLAVERVSGGVRFTTSEDFWGRVGFAWFPDGAPSRGTYERLRGDWYVWSGRGGGFD